MSDTSVKQPRQAQSLEAIPLQKLNDMLQEVWERSPFYTHKWCQAGVNIHRLSSLEEIAQFPFTTRAELLEDQTGHPPLGSNLTRPFYALTRIHRSSGTTRSPLFWADTPQSWAWVMRCSQLLYHMAGIGPQDRLFFALPFGPSSGPWIMHEGACRLGCCCFQAATELPEQLFSIKTFRPTVVVGKPTPLRSLGLALKADGVKTRIVGVKKLILSGESASAELRLQLEELWDAECFDRYGLTEAGPVAGECAAHPGGIHLLESEYIAELIDPNTTRPVREDESGELVLTTLGRFCQPIVRYRTGDFARLIRHHHCACGRTEPLLVGGITRKQTSENISPAKIARRIIATARQHNPFYENASTP